MNPTESEEARALARYLLILQRMGKIHLYSHISHETYTTSRSVKRRNVLEGVRQGVPDYIIIVEGKVLFLELKRLKGGSVSPEQKEWIAHLQGKTTEAQVCKGFDEAKRFIDQHLANPPRDYV